MSNTSGKTRGVPFIVVLTAFIAVVAAMGIGFEYWKGKGKAVAAPDTKITVIATLFPYYDMARSVAGEDADVISLLPPGVSPHHYEPKPSDIRLLGDADVFIYSGPLLEPWANEIIAASDNLNLRVIDASEHALLLLSSDGHGHEEADPHIWLDADNDIAILGAVRDAFKESDPSHAAGYDERALVYEGGLRGLDVSYRDAFDMCRTRTFIQGGHRSFGYLARRYNLDYYATTGADDSEEATATELAGLSTLAREKELPYIFYPAFDSPRAAEVIAGEAGADILPLNPAATVSKQDMENGTTFFDIMTSNLKSLSLALECQ